jgi:succinyl-CoA synthetase alpha subunit
MAILLDENTRVVVQGLTGREGRFHALRNKAYGTQIVAGVTPGKGGSDVEGIPVFDTVYEAVEETGADASLIFVPARFAPEAVYEAADAGVRLIVCITEGIPAHDEARFVDYVRNVAKPRGGAARTVLIGPNCPGLISPGKANMGIMPAEITKPGPVGLVSRSGTLTYQVVYELTTAGLGQSTCVGIGGDPFIGSRFVDLLPRFEADPETEAIVLIGEIGGSDEERAAEWIAANATKPVVAYIAGFEAPEGKRMGHAGAIVSGTKGTAKAKAEALEAVGVPVARNPAEVARLIAKALG